MSRWHRLLKEINDAIENPSSASPGVVQIVQIVQKGPSQPNFEHSEHSEHGCPSSFRDDFEERASIIQGNGIPREWAEGYSILCTMMRPKAYSEERWQQIINDAGVFLDVWGRKAAALGWMALDVFGVNPNAPEFRFDGMGLVALLQGRKVCTIKADAAALDCGNGVYQTFYRKSSLSSDIALWEFKPTKSPYRQKPPQSDRGSQKTLYGQKNDSSVVFNIGVLA